ncbi:MAG: hypothetical protein LBQ22_10005 [Bacteroidales bacterium]|jgi:hypothetical protein|nr:hypothetical protein [Bacteroidales bacterium]
MKATLFLFFVCITGLISAQVNRIVFDENKGQDVLYGECDRNGFVMPEFAEWFDEEYNSYNVNDEVFIPGYDVKFDSIYVFLGTWCSDSHREVPRFVKIMDHPYFAGINVKYFCLDGDKTTDIINTEDFYLQFVPTFIFYYRGEELCRIIEEPRESLEEDIMDLLDRIQP